MMPLRDTPVPIPNTMVKPQRADGTARETVWESRILPGKDGPLVKRSRHHPFTVVTGVRFPYGSPYAIIAQLVERRLAKAKVASSSLVYRSTRVLKILFFKTLFLFIRSILILEIANDKILNSTFL